MAQYEQQVELAMSADEAVHRLYGAISSLRGAGPPQVEGPWVTTQIGMSGFSWGETVAAYVQPGPDRCWVTVRSKSDFALVDWGKNKKNVQTVLDHMLQPPPPPQPAPPPY